MLIESIKKQIDILLKNLDNSEENVSKELISKLQVFADSVLRNVDELSKYDIEEYIKEIYKNNANVSIDSYIKNLNTLKQLIELKKNDDSGLFDLTEKQIEFIKQVCGDTKQFIESTKANKEKNNIIKANIEKYQHLIEKIEVNEKKLNHEEVKVLVTMIDNYSNKDKISILKEILNYNISIEKSKNITHRYINKEPLDVTTIIEKFKEYITDKERNRKFNKSIEYHEEEVSYNIDLDNTTEVVKYLKDNKLFEKFKSVDKLLALLVYGSSQSVKEAYEEFKTKDMLDQSFIYEYPSLWTKQGERHSIKRVKKPKNGDNNSEATLKGYTTGLFRNELYDIIDFYEANGVDYKKDKGVMCLFKKNLDSIKYMMAIGKKYNININPSTFSIGDNMDERSDILIECDLLNPIPNLNFNNLEDTYSVEQLRKITANINPSFIGQVQEGHIAYLQKHLQENHKVPSVVFSTKRKPYNFSTDFSNLKGIFEPLRTYKKDKVTSTARIKEYALNNDMTNISFNGDIENYEELEKIAKGDKYIRLDSDDSIIESPFIKDLDNKYGVPQNDYLYQIEGLRISRYKVIRLYQAFRDYNMNSLPENQLSEYDMRLFSIAYRTYIKNDIYTQIKENIESLELGGQRL